MSSIIMSCRGSGGHLFVYTIFHKHCAANHLRCCWGDTYLHHNGGFSLHYTQRTDAVPFCFGFSDLMPAFFHRDPDADVLYCAAPAVPAQLLLANHQKTAQ